MTELVVYTILSCVSNYFWRRNVSTIRHSQADGIVEASITVFEFPWDVRDFSPPVSFIPDNGLADECIPARNDFTGLLLGYGI